MSLAEKTFLVPVLLIGLCFGTLGADTLKINITNKFKIDETGQISGLMTIKQQFLTKEGVCFREVFYDETSGQISGYCFYFYKNEKLFTKEFYNSKDSLLYLLKYDYDANGNESTVTKLTAANGKNLEEQEKTVNFYTNNKISMIKKTINGKMASSVKYKYNSDGFLIYEKTVNKPPAKADLKLQIKQYSQDENKMISKADVTGKENSGNAFHYILNYTYDKTGHLSEIKKVTTEGNPIGSQIYKYTPSFAPLQYEEHDATGKMVLMFGYEYRKHFMEKGRQVSRYENL